MEDSASCCQAQPGSLASHFKNLKRNNLINKTIKFNIVLYKTPSLQEAVGLIYKARYCAVANDLRHYTVMPLGSSAWIPML